ncbi:MAG: flagellar basal body-associated FliL family protein [Bdellovibrionales bacterium]|nr:flagellar basal body-associated FliL family protein [Bdellovibrionales bacterium]
MAEDAKAAAPAAPASGGGGSKIVTIITIVNLLICLGTIGALLVAHKKQNAAPQLGDIQPSAENAHGEEKKEEHGGGHGEAKSEEHGGGEHGGGHGGESKKASNDARTIPLEQFTVNLATPGGTAQKFVRVNIALELGTDEVEKEVQAKMPQVRNAIIDLFNSKRPNDLVSAEQREYLKEEIRNALNSFMTNGKVKGVYFTNFAVTG